MVRREFILGSLALLLATPAAAQSSGQAIVDRIVADLRRQGYSDFRIRRTLLGRVLIDADGSGRSREIVLNPHSGEILRDIWHDANDDLFGGHDSAGDDSEDSGSAGGSASGGDTGGSEDHGSDDGGNGGGDDGSDGGDGGNEDGKHDDGD